MAKGDYQARPVKFYNAHQYLTDAYESLAKKTNIIDTLCSLSLSYEFRNEVIDICDIFERVYRKISEVYDLSNEVKDRLLLYNDWALSYYEAAKTNYVNFDSDFCNIGIG